MDKRADDLNGDGDLPQPGTEESTKEGNGGSVEGPGNVSVDEPTAPALEDDNLTTGGENESSDGENADDEDDDSSDDDESSADGN